MENYIKIIILATRLRTHINNKERVCLRLPALWPGQAGYPASA